MSHVAPAGIERTPLSHGWELAGTPAGACAGPEGLDQVAWQTAAVPGTVAGALGADAVAGLDLDASDWWFRLRFDAELAAPGEEVVLSLGGLATVCEVHCNGQRVLDSQSMFVAHEVDVGEALVGPDNELIICCRALSPLLAARRRPRARWRTRLVSNGNLRFYRTMLIGRCPGFAPGPAVVGPWRPVCLERRRGVVLSEPGLRATLDGSDGQLQVSARVRALPGVSLPAQLTLELEGPTGRHTGTLSVHDEPGEIALATGRVRVPDAEPWWPHTHGRPARYEVRIAAGPGQPVLYRARVGFRQLGHARDVVRDGLDLRVNGVPVFARGAVWTPGLHRPHAPESELRRTLERIVAGGMNMLRVAGIGAYESDGFYELCDELGILVWQDFMFANLDYPESDPAFMATVEREGRELLARVGGRPSLAVLCGGSEVAQQVAMLGLDPALAEGPLYGELLPGLVAAAGVQAPYVPSAPWGGDLPFRPDRGVANYYGVGAYLRPLEDSRRAEVRFASECLAFANVPDDSALEELDVPGGVVAHHPAWKAGVPRDPGAGWDFDDVRDHYLQLLFGVDPVALRSVDHDRYLELSRAVSGEVMAEVMGEWRRAGSPCRGALVLWCRDLAAGAGWGVLDHRGEPKVAYHHLRRALAPVALWSTDEGLGGVLAHLANDGPEPVAATLRVALYRDFETLVDEASERLEIPAHGQLERNVETLLGRFVDAAWAYRFGPPAQDLIALSLERDRGDGEPPELLSQAFRFPAGRLLSSEPAGRLGICARLTAGAGGGARLAVRSERFAYGTRVSAPGYRASDDAFGIEPGHERVIELSESGQAPETGAATVTALNLSGRVRVSMEDR